MNRHVILSCLLLALFSRASVQAQDYRYRPVQAGIEIRNGGGRFNRPLYSTVPRPDRLVALVGDRPAFMLMKISATRRMNKLANLRLGYAGGPWLSEVTPVVARYCMGQQQYRVGPEQNRIEIDAVRAMSFEGLLLPVKRGRQPIGPLVLALGARAVANYDQNPAAAFNPDECQGTKIEFVASTGTVSGTGFCTRLRIYRASTRRLTSAFAAPLHPTGCCASPCAALRSSRACRAREPSSTPRKGHTCRAAGN